MSTASPTAAPRLARGLVLADLLPGAVVRDGALVVGGAGLVGLAAQVSVPLGFTPVPLTLGTLAVLLVSAALGRRRGALSLGLYAAAGLAGVPWFSDGTGGRQVVTSASFGYVLGYVAAAVLVGALAEHRGDRTPVRTALTVALGTAAIYAFGITWLVADLHVGLGMGLRLGVTPFLVGDAVKALLACALLPGTWALVSRSSAGGRPSR